MRRSVKGDHAVRKTLLRLIKFIASVYVEIFRDTPMIVQAMIIYFGIRAGQYRDHSRKRGRSGYGIKYRGLYGRDRQGRYRFHRSGAERRRVGHGYVPHEDHGVYRTAPGVQKYHPGDGQYLLTNLKMTSVLNVIAVQELFMAAKTVGGNYYKYFESYLVIAVIYFVLCFAFNKVFNFLEKRMEGKSDYALAVEYMDND